LDDLPADGRKKTNRDASGCPGGHDSS